MDPQAYSKMYFSLNFRWPLLMGNGCNTGAMQPTVSNAHSAFKALPSSCPSNSLPPISSLRSDRETAGVPLPPSHHAPAPSGAASQLSGAQDARGARIGSQTQATSQAASALTQQQPHSGGSGSELKSAVCGVSPAMSGVVPGANLSGIHHPATHHHPPPHPAFPVPLGGLVQPPPDSMGPLQHLMNGNKALALTHYLADPLAKAALMDLGRYGHYPLGKKLFGCPQCRYVTDRKNNLKRHVATMHQECDKVLECCGVVFKNKASLRDHVLIFHSNGYMCRFCGRNFCRKALLKRHLTVHSGQKDYVCSLCDYATSHKSNLERHKKVHERQGSDQDEPEPQSDRPGLSYPASHANCITSCTSGYSRNLDDGARAFQGGHPGAIFGKSPLGSRFMNPDHLAGNIHDRGLPGMTSQTSNRHHSSQHMSSAGSSAIGGSTGSTSLGLSKRDDGLDLNLCQSDMGSYSVDRILNTCKSQNAAITVPDLDELDEDAHDLMANDDDDDDDDDDTHSSGLIDVVHVDLQE